MNILHTTLGFYPATAWGGPVKVVHQNAKELIRRGHRVTVYCTNLLNKRDRIRPGTFEEDIDGIRVVYFRTWNIRSWPGTLGPIWLPDLPKHLSRELRTFDVVHLNGYRNLMGLPILRRAHQYSIPVVMQPHGSLPIVGNSGLVKHLYDRTLSSYEWSRIDAVVALQDSERQQAISAGIPESRISVIPNGIDHGIARSLPEKGSFRARFGFASDRALALFAGRINWRKGPDLLVKAFSGMPANDFQLAIAGPDDGQQDEVERLIVQLGLTARVKIVGHLAGDDVFEAYRDADLFVLPCRMDTYPMAIVESCLSGTPILVCNTCEISHLIDGVAGESVPFDVDAFSRAMYRLLSDRALRERYARNARELVYTTFSLQKVGQQMEDLYYSIAPKRAGAAARCDR